VSFCKAPRLESPHFLKSKPFRGFEPSLYVICSLLAYYEPDFHSVTKNKMTVNCIYATFNLNRAIKDASCEQNLFEFLATLPKFVSWRCSPLNAVQTTEFVKLIRRKITKIVPTRCHILKPKCTKIDFDWDSAPDTPLGELTALPRDSLAGFKGAYF